MELRGKKAMVLGLARTGTSAARFLTRMGAEVAVTDYRSEEDLRRETGSLAGLPVRFLLGGEEPEWIHGMELLIPSPGVPPSNSLIREAQRRKIEILSEIEMASRFLRAPMVAVTGTNGKSTTTTLIGEMLKADGIRTFVGGNIGNPLIEAIPGEWDWAVVEVSSFQLEWVETFCPKIAVLLNISEDHLDRYPDVAAYRGTKAKILSGQREDDVAVLNRNDPLVWDLRESIDSRTVSFGWDEVREGAFADAEAIVWRSQGAEERFPLSSVKIHGVHNIENLMGAVAAAKSVGVKANAIRRVMESFPGLEHRLEFVREKNGVRFYDDSKGTNVGALFKSLQSFAGPVILIAGGIHKGGDYGVLEEQVKGKVKRLILLGQSKEMIQKALGHLTETVLVESLDAAVREAWRAAAPGDVVLLSPACSSFDMFRDYAERGRIFKELVQAL